MENLIVLEMPDSNIDVMETRNFTELSEALVYQIDSKKLNRLLLWAESEMMNMGLPTYEDDSVTNFLLKSVKYN